MNMATITASLERSLTKCSLNGEEDAQSRSRSSSSSSSSSSPNPNLLGVDLNSQLSLPYHWEQCLDLKSGEVYYINWRTGEKSKEDPRTATATATATGGESSSENGSSSYDDDDDTNTDSDDDESSTQSSLNSYSRQQCHYDNNQEEDSSGVLVVAGCKICLMYFMVPKHDADCPKCGAQLLHFDTSSSSSSHTIA